MIREFFNGIADSYIEFFRAQGINAWLPLLILSTFINLHYLRLLLNKKKFRSLTTSQKVIMVQSFGVTILFLIGMVFRIGIGD